MERDRAGRLGQRAALGDRIDRVDDPGAHDIGGLDRHQPDRAEADDGDARAGHDVGVACAEPGGGERVGHHQRLFGGDAFGDRHRVHVGGGDAEPFGLDALELRGQAVARAGVVRAVDDVAREARSARAAADRGGHHHRIADLHLSHAEPTSTTSPTASWPTQKP